MRGSLAHHSGAGAGSGKRGRRALTAPAPPAAAAAARGAQHAEAHRLVLQCPLSAAPTDVVGNQLLVGGVVKGGAQVAGGEHLALACTAQQVVARWVGRGRRVSRQGLEGAARLDKAQQGRTQVHAVRSTAGRCLRKHPAQPPNAPMVSVSLTCSHLPSSCREDAGRHFTMQNSRFAASASWEVCG